MYINHKESPFRIIEDDWINKNNTVVPLSFNSYLEQLGGMNIIIDIIKTLIITTLTLEHTHTHVMQLWRSYAY